MNTMYVGTGDPVILDDAPERPSAMELWTDYANDVHKRNFTYLCPHNLSYFLVRRFPNAHVTIKAGVMQQFINELDAELVTNGWIQPRGEE